MSRITSSHNDADEIFHVDRAKYDELGWLLIRVIVVNLLVPILAIVVFGRRITKGKT